MLANARHAVRDRHAGQRQQLRKHQRQCSSRCPGSHMPQKRARYCTKVVLSAEQNTGCIAGVMTVAPEQTHIPVRDVHQAKAPRQCSSRCPGSSRWSDVHEASAIANVVTLSGIVTLVRDQHSSKAHPPMLVTLFGIVTLVRDVQPKKAYAPTLVTLSGIVTLVRDLQ